MPEYVRKTLEVPTHLPRPESLTIHLYSLVVKSMIYYANLSHDYISLL